MTFTPLRTLRGGVIFISIFISKMSEKVCIYNVFLCFSVVKKSTDKKRYFTVRVRKNT